MVSKFARKTHTEVARLQKIKLQHDDNSHDSKINNSINGSNK